jgi:hypothetical protein
VLQRLRRRLWALHLPGGHLLLLLLLLLLPLLLLPLLARPDLPLGAAL